MSDFDDLVKDMEDGIAGRNAGIPMGFQRLNNHITIRGSMIYVLGGFTGSGKTALVDDAFVLNPADWIIKDQGKSGIELEIIYWSMERKKKFKLFKWISRRIFLDTGVIIPVNRLMGWVPKESRLNKEEFELVLTYRDYVDALLRIVTLKDYPENPTGIRKYIKERALQNGEIQDLGDYQSKYIPNNPNKVILNIYDHIGLIKKEKDLLIKKEIIDKSSADARYFRDFFGISSVFVSQFNRDIANPMRIKNGDVEPMLEDFKDSGCTQEDADVVLSLFDPMRYKVADPGRYNLDKLKDVAGRKKYRSLRILKNSYGSDDIRIGLAFQPIIGMFKEMPKLVDTTEDVYQSVIDDSYFLNYNG